MILQLFLAFALGVLVGPSLHHVAVRSARHEPLGFGVPTCEACAVRMQPLAVRCRNDHPVRRRQPVWWAVAGVATVAAFHVADGGWTLPAFVLFAWLSVILTITDLDEKLIPNAVLFPGGGLAVALLVGGLVMDDRSGVLLRVFLCAAGYFAVFFLVAVLARGGFGFGDVKLAALMGAFTAVPSLRTFLLAVVFTGFYGGLPAIYLLIRGAARDRQFPYGPAMVAGAWTALLVSVPMP